MSPDDDEAEGPRPVALGALLARTADREPDGMEGVAELTPVLAARLGASPAWLGQLGETWDGRWDEDLRDGGPALRQAGRFVADALAEGASPFLLAGDCAIALATLTAVAQAAPDAWVVWLDAHGDANTPITTPSGYLGGMGLAGACGLWEAYGFPGQLDADQVVLGGVRDLDADERRTLDEAGIPRLALADVAEAVAGREVYVHLDLDVCDPTEVPAVWAVPGGATLDELEEALGAIAARAASVLGCEVTSIPATSSHDEIADAVAALLG